MSDCKTIFLSDEPSFTDDLENKSHQTIAEIIEKIIRDSEESRAIGLEGKWGSGKSTIINILKQKFIKKEIFIIFDAWVHQGNPLRKSFLKDFLNALFPNNKPDSVKVIESKLDFIYSEKSQSEDFNLTLVESIIGIALFFIFPIGIALINKGLDQGISFNFSGIYNYYIIFGFLFTFSPLIFSAFFFCINSLHTKEENDKKNNFNPFLVLFKIFPKKTKIISLDDPETSSFEFEEYFKNILDEFYRQKKNEKKRIIIVFDNIDRISINESEQILSTLQIFLGDNFHKGKTENGQNNLYKNLWIIIPYNNTDFHSNFLANNFAGKKIDSLVNLTNSKYNEKCYLDSFLEKRLQIKISIPPLQLINFQKYVYDLLEDCFPIHEKIDKYNIYYFILNSFQNINEITPRKVKLFINQIASYHLHFCGTIPLSHVAYFVYIQNKNMTTEILNKISTGSFEKEEASIYNKLGPSIIGNFASLFYFSNDQLSLEVLYYPKFEKQIIDNDIESFENQISINNERVWLNFDKFISEEWLNQDRNNLLNSASLLIKLDDHSLPLDNEIYLKILERLNFISKSQDEWMPITTPGIEGICDLINLIHNDEFSKVILNCIIQSKYIDNLENQDNSKNKIILIQETVDIWANLIVRILMVREELGINLNSINCIPLKISPGIFIEFTSMLAKYDQKKHFWNIFDYNNSTDSINTFFIGIAKKYFSRRHLGSLEYLLYRNFPIDLGIISQELYNNATKEDVEHIYEYYEGLRLISESDNTYSQLLSKISNGSTAILDSYAISSARNDKDAQALLMFIYLKYSELIRIPSTPYKQNQKGFNLLIDQLIKIKPGDEISRRVAMYIINDKDPELLISVFNKNVKLKTFIKVMVQQIIEFDKSFFNYEFIKDNSVKLKDIWN